MRVALAQTNPIVGDLAGNVRRLLAAASNAQAQGAELLVAPELALLGYPPRDLLERPGFVADALEALKKLVHDAPLPMVVGAIVSAQGDPLEHDATRVANAAVLISHGAIVACHRKQLLPNYDVFDEPRYFQAGERPTIVKLFGINIALTVCEDIWSDKLATPRPRYNLDPIEQAKAAGAELVINLSASPYDRHKPKLRAEQLRNVAKRHNVALIYCNQVGGNDGLLFDGRSLAIAADGTLAMRAPAYTESLSVIVIEPQPEGPPKLRGELASEPASWEEDITQALCMGLSDYLRKTGHERVILGISGGIDSALVAALATRALGSQRVVGVAMPSRYSSEGSVRDAVALANNLSIRLDTVPIDPMVRAYETALAKPFLGLKADITEENLQSRVRGVLMMAYSNKFNFLLLNTGNKSEIAVGYCTLYGDTNGSLSLIGDLYKTEVYALARHLNSGDTELIPNSTLTKPPSAELREDQKDSDSLPPYDVLDDILRGYVDEARSQQDLVDSGFDAATVRKIALLVARSEWKRRQMPFSLRVSRKAFGEGRRLPLAQRWGY